MMGLWPSAAHSRGAGQAVLVNRGFGAPNETADGRGIPSDQPGSLGGSGSTFTLDTLYLLPDDQAT